MRLMAKLALIGALAFASLGLAPASPWTPSSAQVSRLEALAKPSPGVDAMTRYDRDYAGTTISGRKIVTGLWVRRPWGALPQTPNPRIVPFSDLPRIDDGGCLIVTVMYDVTADKIVFLECNGRG